MIKAACLGSTIAGASAATCLAKYDVVVNLVCGLKGVSE